MAIEDLDVSHAQTILGALKNALLGIDDIASDALDDEFGKTPIVASVSRERPDTALEAAEWLENFLTELDDDQREVAQTYREHEGALSDKDREIDELIAKVDELEQEVDQLEAEVASLQGGD